MPGPGRSRRAAGSPMGLSRSKPKPSTGEERKGSVKEPTWPASKPKGKPMEKQPERAADRPGDSVPTPAESPQLGRGAARWQGPSSSSEERSDTSKEKSSKKKVVIPQIIVTRASRETLVSHSSLEIEEQRTIREHADWGPYSRHRNPSTADVYRMDSRE
ncbi:spermatogenesis-associated protein 33 [Dasypus novemcinctus]|uniref:spermatogenesis-associated protein 33 n=1 Tax=Dasypus novemcinctus TaxID=9361 RepID=UPI00265E7E28|nr:spermatogenesis-associated protein 33 [Dasypus novemcinctus]